VTRHSLSRGIAEVRARDPVLDRLVDSVGPIRHRPRNPDGPFGALICAIVFQQLAGRAAQAILTRVLAVVGTPLSPARVAETTDETLRGAGLSANKLASLRDLCAKLLDGSVDLQPSRRADEEITANLTTVRGIGRWTAEMYLLFELRRLDVWPVDNLGVRHGYALGWALDTPPTRAELEAIGERYRPYRSVVARYCWEAVALHRRGADPTLR
jgi:DNA-3-methyladenine glycosylase II